MNVLLTSPGVAVATVRAFIEAAGPEGRVIVADHDPLAPAASAASANAAVAVPSPHDPSYLDTLLEAVEAHAVDVLVPLSDGELPVLASHVDAFAALGCTVVVSEPEFVAMAADKLATVAFCLDHGMRVPATWSPTELAPLDDADLPAHLFIRPRQGSGSRGARPVHRDELRRAVEALPDCIVQEELRRAELTIDALLHFDGTPLHYVPRLRLLVEAGRSAQAVTVDRPGLGEWTTRVLRLAGEHGARGPISIQAFFGPPEPTLIEINARLTHGLPLTIAAGGDYPAWILHLVEGRQPDAILGTYENGMRMSTYPEPIIWTR